MSPQASQWINNFGTLPGYTTNTHSFQLNATASSGLPVTYSSSNTSVATISGNTVTIVGVGTSTITASQAGDANNLPVSATQTLSVSLGTQTFFGNFGGAGGSAVTNRVIRSDATGSTLAAFVNGSSGTLAGYISSVQEAFVLNFTLSNGAFSAQTTALTNSGATGQTLTFNGTLSNGTLSGTIQELSLPFSAAVDPSTGTSATLSGLYSAGSTYAIVGTQGEVFVLAVAGNSVSTGTGTVSGNGSFTVQTAQGGSVSGAIASQTSAISGTITLPTGGTVTFSGLSSAVVPQIQPSSQAVNAGATARLSVSVSGATSYQWQYNGTNIAGATSSTLTLANVAATQGGLYTALVTTASGTVTSNAASLAVNISARLANLSSRAFVGTGSQALIAGFIVNGSTSKQILVRGIGPSLNQFSVSGALANTSLALFDGTSTNIATDTGWSNSIVTGTSAIRATVQAATTAIFNQLYAFVLPTSSADSAMVATLPGGNSYSAQLTGTGGSTGVGLVELYDADSGTPVSDMTNISTRAFVGTGSQVAVVGFVISGSTSQTVLLRGVGPALAQFGISGVLATPQLVLYDSTGMVIASNTGWGNASVAGTSTVVAGIAPATGSIMGSVYAFALPTGSADCAMLATLPPGTYTAQLNGTNGSTGIGLVEVYNIP